MSIHSERACTTSQHLTLAPRKKESFCRSSSIHTLSFAMQKRVTLDEVKAPLSSPCSSHSPVVLLPWLQRYGQLWKKACQSSSMIWTRRAGMSPRGKGPFFLLSPLSHFLPTPQARACRPKNSWSSTPRCTTTVHPPKRRPRGRAAR